MPFKIILAIAFFITGTASPLFADNTKVDELIRKKAKELMSGYKGQKDLTIAILDTDKTPLSAKVTTIAYKVVFDDGRFSIVERDLLDHLTKEMELQQTGLVKIAAEVGKLTGANLILIIRNEDNDIRMRIVSVEKGIILAYNFIPVEEITAAAGGGEKRRSVEPYYRYGYHSPLVAGLVSVFPVWSGSWNVRWTEWGMLLVLCKTGAWIPPIVYSVPLRDKEKKLKSFRNGVSSYLYNFKTPEAFMLILLWYNKLSRSVDSARSKYKQALTYSAISWAGVTAIDIIASAIFVHLSNQSLGGARYDESNHVSWSVAIRRPQFFQITAQASPMNPLADGMDLEVSYHF